MKDIKKSVKLTDEQTRQYYDETRSTITKPFADVEADIKEQLLAELAQAKYAQKLEKLSDLSYQTPDSLLPVAKLLKMQVKESDLFSREGANDGLLKNRQIIEAAFSHDVLELGNNSDPVQFDNDTVVVLRVSKHILAAEKPLADVKLLIFDKLAKEKASIEAIEIGKKLLSAKGYTLKQDQLIKENNLNWNSIKQSERDSAASPSDANELAFNLARVGEKSGRSLLNGDYVIVSLKAINDGNSESLDKEHVNSITQQIEANYGVMDYELYIAGLMSKAVIVKH